MSRLVYLVILAVLAAGVACPVMPIAAGFAAAYVAHTAVGLKRAANLRRWWSFWHILIFYIAFGVGPSLAALAIMGRPIAFGVYAIAFPISCAACATLLVAEWLAGVRHQINFLHGSSLADFIGFGWLEEASA